jgi:hypothetical protein
MKFSIQLKDPDGAYDSIQDAAKASLMQIEGISESEREALLDQRKAEFGRIAGKWLRYGEYLTVEIDTEARTCTVVEAVR